ncbi:MAG: cupredoxin domain-containing protein [Chloroflexi bacterium]|nr:cupredoxin domain-containing protein [Chloroflexota bacterium]
MLRKVVVIALLLPAVIIAGCAGSAEVKVSMKDFLYIPKEVTINVGEKVTWINDDVEPHTVTTKDWDSGAINTGQSYSHVFSTAGTFEVLCLFHPGMIGKVTVNPRPSRNSSY